MTVVLVVNITVCLLSVLAALKLLGMVGLLKQCIEKEQYIISCHCIPMRDLHYAFVATVSFYEFMLLVACAIYFPGASVHRNGVWRYQ